MRYSLLLLVTVALLMAANPTLSWAEALFGGSVIALAAYVMIFGGVEKR